MTQYVSCRTPLFAIFPTVAYVRYCLEQPYKAGNYLLGTLWYWDGIDVTCEAFLRWETSGFQSEVRAPGSIVRRAKKGIKLLSQSQRKQTSEWQRERAS